MINAPNRVLIWQSQLTANDFPPVCAMTGEPAETWRKFGFSTAPPYAFWVGGLLAAALMSQRASGYLPLTKASVKKLRVLTWSLAATMPLGLVAVIAGAAVGSAFNGNSLGSAIAFLVFALGIAAMLVGLIGLLIARRAFGPTGKILEPQPGHFESLIELRNVHPKFVAAVQQLQHSRTQSAYQAQAPIPGKWQ